MKTGILLAGLAVIAIDLAPVKAQTLPGGSTIAQNRPDARVIVTDNFDLNRAKNLARQAAVSANGGLNRYRPENAMHGPAAQAPFVENSDGSWTFTIKGRRPESNNFTIETVVTVSKDGKQVNVNYNGPIR